MTSVSSDSRTLPDHLVERLREVLGPGGIIEDVAEQERYWASWGGTFRVPASLVVRPGSTAEVSAVVSACAKARVPVIPQGGNTGLAGGAQPVSPGGVIVSLERMRAIRAVDPVNGTITVEAGTVLAEVQEQAERINRMFPLSLASQGSCQIGGNISTNAGGTQVLRYGNTRALVLGLEVVLPNGQIWDGLRGLRKDSTGYDLKHLFIGAEGTLGIVTAAVLRLMPRPRDVATAFAGVPDPAAALTLFAHAQDHLGESLTGFELMRQECLHWVLVALPGEASPFAEQHPWYVLVEATGQGSPGTLMQPLEATLAAGFEAGAVLDAVVAGSEAQRRRLWALREGQAEAQVAGGPTVKHDISVPVSAVPDFIAEADAALERAFPGLRHFAFGHVGDGNIHYNPMAPLGVAADDFKAERDPINRIVHDIVARHGGSISAEHGLGQLRTSEAHHYKSTTELEMVRALKHTFDPHGIMNPGKII